MRRPKCQRQFSIIVQTELAVDRAVIVNENLARDNSTAFHQHSELNQRVNAKPRPTRITALHRLITYSNISQKFATFNKYLTLSQKR